MNTTSLQCPELALVDDYLGYYASFRGDAVAAVSNGRHLTYSELRLDVQHLANAMRIAGVCKGDVVATLADPGEVFLLTFLASLSIGAIWVGLNPKYTIEEYQYILEDCKPKVIFCDQMAGSRDYVRDIIQATERLSELRAVVVCDDKYDFDRDSGPMENDLFRMMANINSSRPISLNSFKSLCPKGLSLSILCSAVHVSDPAIIVYTSGSTGSPKGAVLSHNGLTKCCRIQRRYWSVTPLKILNNLPINHIGCVGDLTAFSIISGGTLYFQERFDPERIVKSIEQDQITFLGQVPTMFQLLLDKVEELGEVDFSSLKIVAWSGAPASRELVEKLVKICPVSTSYGLTETVGSITFVPPTNNVEELSGSVGWPVPEYEVRLANGDFVVNEVGEQGEVQVRGDFLLLRYWNNEQATQAAFTKDGWYKTGDLAVWKPNGAIAVVGRANDMFISGGYNVYPREIEQRIEAIPGVSLVAVVGVPDDVFGETGIAFLTIDADAGLCSDDIRSLCSKNLANYKVPKSFVIVEELPILPIGKIDKSALKERWTLQQQPNTALGK
ncbi:class I adenylate-forming enzyme family protein [Kordiimonas lacus]|uniref:Fatty-acyl-CoA synthase n=1 Tax=Kordiimonas lacus TaxID=637679 RepID=A0A1G7F541_9PROT|nr:class I adenylate-forming enzyme family protein [Kordiimonas lacus]SDE71064.1 fatty-acyl-CoA synthase [Kordiimonas lacus]